MTRRSVSPDRVKVDPLFYIPSGAEDNFVYTRENTDEDYLTDYIEEEITDIEFEDVSGEEESEELASPEVLGIISQTVRTGPGGQQVVDVVFEIDDVDGATNYEIQVTKI